MSAWKALLGIGLLLPGTAAGFETRDKRPQTHSVPANPDLSKKGGAPLVGPLVRYRDGGYITDINGQRAQFLFRPGMIVEINGKGFGARAPDSNVSLYPGSASVGMFLDIACWTDTRVVVVVPSDPARWIKATEQGRMILQGVKAGIMTYYDIGPIKFVAAP